MRSLGTLGGESSVANAINNRREVAGSSDTRNGNTRAYLWTPGHGMRNLGTLGGKNSAAIDLNDATQVVGSSETRDGNAHAFLWTPAEGWRIWARWAAQQSGMGHQPGRGHRRPERDRRRQVGRVPVDPGRGMRSLGTLPGLPGSFATHVNTHLRVVGHSFATQPVSRSCGCRAAGCSPCPRSAAPAGRPRTERVRPDRGREHQGNGDVPCHAVDTEHGPAGVMEQNRGDTVHSGSVSPSLRAWRRPESSADCEEFEPAPGPWPNHAPQSSPLPDEDRACGPRPRRVARSAPLHRSQRKA